MTANGVIIQTNTIFAKGKMSAALATADCRAFNSAGGHPHPNPIRQWGWGCGVWNGGMEGGLVGCIETMGYAQKGCRQDHQ